MYETLWKWVPLILVLSGLMGVIYFVATKQQRTRAYCAEKVGVGAYAAVDRGVEVKIIDINREYAVCLASEGMEPEKLVE